MKRIFDVYWGITMHSGGILQSSLYIFADLFFITIYETAVTLLYG